MSKSPSVSSSTNFIISLSIAIDRKGMDKINKIDVVKANICGYIMMDTSFKYLWILYYIVNKYLDIVDNLNRIKKFESP